MSDPEQVEKTRQAIMRLRELLDLLRGELEAGEQAYARLFDGCTPEEIASLKQKDLQQRAALGLIDHPEALGDAALHLRFVMHNLERDFEQLYDNVMTE